jgi:phage shock protein PspC (stress-responsive transcriptional regulator)
MLLVLHNNPRSREMEAAATPQPSPQDASLAGARAWFRDNGLVRPREGRMLTGVTAGLARRYGVNRLVARTGMVLSWFLVSPIPYLALWILMPKE